MSFADLPERARGRNRQRLHAQAERRRLVYHTFDRIMIEVHRGNHSEVAILLRELRRLTINKEEVTSCDT